MSNKGSYKLNHFRTVIREDNINRLLSGEKVILPSTEPGISFGKSDEKVTITVFLSLLCSACVSKLTEVLGLTNSLGNVRIQIIISPGRDEMTLEWLALGIYLKVGKMGKAIMILLEWYLMYPDSRKKLSQKERRQPMRIIK